MVLIPVALRWWIFLLLILAPTSKITTLSLKSRVMILGIPLRKVFMLLHQPFIWMVVWKPVNSSICIYIPSGIIKLSPLSVWNLSEKTAKPSRFQMVGSISLDQHMILDKLIPLINSSSLFIPISATPEIIKPLLN